jgi:Na+/H+ antiporter NhaC
MRLPYVRFTVRGMMIAVAIVSLFLALIAYSQRLRMLATRHESEAFRLFNPISVIGAGPPGTILRRTPGQPGILAYQVTPQGLEQMKTAEEYSYAAANINTVIAALLLVLVIFGMVRLLTTRRHQRRQGNASSPPQ